MIESSATLMEKFQKGMSFEFLGSMFSFFAWKEILLNEQNTSHRNKLKLEIADLVKSSQSLTCYLKMVSNIQ